MNARPSRLILGAIGAIAVAIPLVAATGMAIAQNPTSAAGTQDRIARLTLERVEIREALKQLFKQVDQSYSIAPEVMGEVTADVKNVDLETALRIVLKQVAATYRVESGVYIVVPAPARDAVYPTSGTLRADGAQIENRPASIGATYASGVRTTQAAPGRQEPPPAGPRAGFGQGGPPPGRPGEGFQFGQRQPGMAPPMMGGGGGGTAMVEDGTYLFIVQGGMVYKLNKSDLRVVAIGGLPRPGMEGPGERGRDPRPGTTPPPPRGGGGGRAPK